MRTWRSVRRVLLLAIVVSIGSFGGNPAASVGAPDQPPTPATECPELTDTITRLYSATLLRQPDERGLDFWSGQWQTGERDLLEIADHLTESPEFRSRYGHLDDQ